MEETHESLIIALFVFVATILVVVGVGKLKDIKSKRHKKIELKNKDDHCKCDSEKDHKPTS